MQIIPLSEGVFTIDKTKIFVPFDLNADDLQKRPVGSLLVEVQPFVVITASDILLLDAGLGFSKQGVLQIHANLKEHNILPGDITKVLMTHLHKDHAGGVSMKDRLGNFIPAFPSATYYVQQRELNFAIDTGFPSYMTEEISFLDNNRQVVLLRNDKGVIDDYIHYEVTAAHCPYHQVFWIYADDEILFFGGDDAPQLQQMKSRFIAKYDYNGKKCMELRQQWWQEGKEKHWTFLFYHDVKTPFYKG
ncbi:MAG TPA: MBL fold metallo-hydrolase [Chitinophagaceae bacterium]|nr:MBL fold metallo-hydrolase [Chitinophagaceae bacterium]